MRIRITNKKVPKAEFGIPGPPKPFDYSGGMKKLLGTFDAMAQPNYGYKPMGLPERPAYKPQELNFDQAPGMKKILGTFDPGAPLFQGAPKPKSNIGYTPMGLPSRESITGTGVQTQQEQANYDPWKEDLAAGVFAFKGMLTGANAVTDFFRDQRQQRNFNRAMVDDRLGARATAPTSGSRGDYMVNEGLFRPDDTYVPNKGMFTNQFQPGFRTMELGGGIIPDMIADPMAMFMPSQEMEIVAPAPESKEKTDETKSSDLNPMVSQTWQDLNKEFKGIQNKGTWGDQKHKQRKSDHNTGNALDVGIESRTQGDAVVGKLIKEADTRNINYIIFNKKIWNPTEGWKDYVPTKANGNNPHTDHVHISFNTGGNNNNSQEDPRKSSEESISLSHNNPGNIHYGDFTRSWNAKKGAPDNNGHVAVFGSMQDGLNAMEQLLFGPKYENLTVSQARNKWVNGSPDQSHQSSGNIVQALGKDVSLNKLSPEERKTLVGEFIKFEDRRTFDALKKQNLFDNGGEYTNPSAMKIRITNAPEGDLNQMAYGGQMGYGLDLNRRKVYTDMPESMADTYSNSITEEDNPEEPYVLEAEGGETILRPDGSHFNITGKRHSQGGEKLTGSQAPEGSFIYSDTAKMRLSGPMLKMFGKPEKGKFTPAEIAKQYNVNSYMAVLKDKNADPLQKETAQKMIDNYQKKLSALALMQEAKKGFRDGIPQVAMPYLESIMGAMPQQEGGQEQMPQAKYGGHLPHYQTKGAVTPREFDINGRKISANRLDAEPGVGWNKLQTIGNTTLYEFPGAAGKTMPGAVGSSWTPGRTVQGGKTDLKFTVEDLKNRPGLYRSFLEKEGWKNATPEEQQAALDRMRKGTRSNYVPGKTQIAVPGIDPKYAYIETPGEGVPPMTSTTPPGNTTTTTNPGPRAGSPGQMQSSGYNTGWMTPDKVNMLASMALPPKKFLPYVPALNAVAPEPVFEDWRAKAAARQAMYNTAARTMGNYGPTQGLAANLALMAGQQGDALIQDIAGTETRNVGIANQFSGINAEMANKLAEYDAKRKQSLYDGNVIANQQYRNAWRDYLNKNARTFGQGWNNASMLGAMNATNENYQIDPRSGRIMFRNLGNAFGMTGAPKAQGLTQEQYLEALKNLKNKELGLSDDQINTAMRIQFPQLAAMSGSRGGNSLANLQALFNQAQQ
jgi:hypothetical protein